MKFEKSKAVENLTAKFTEKAKGIDLQRTITEAVDNCIAMVGEESEMELDAFVGFAEKFVSSALGLARHENSNVATKMQEQIDALKQQIEGKTPPKPNEDRPPKSDDPAIQAMLDKINKMEAQLQAKEKEATIAQKRSQLSAKMGESIKDKNWIEDYLKEISITEETDVEAKAKDFVAFYNKTHSGGGRTTPKPAGGDDDAPDTYVKTTVAQAAQIKKQLSTTTGGSPVRSTTVNTNN